VQYKRQHTAKQPIEQNSGQSSGNNVFVVKNYNIFYKKQYGSVEIYEYNFITLL